MLFNSICSPEMSMYSTDEEESGPHAFVHFKVDDAKDLVPLNFVHRFPRDWRTGRWDKNYLFKTFWSPIPGDTPQAILKRSPEIPCFEQGSSLEKAGYYRASVLAVEESKSSLENLLDKKRISVVPVNMKWSSFDSQNKPQVPTSKPADRKPKKKKGINKSATRDNLKEEMKDIASQFPFLNDDVALSPQPGTSKAFNHKPSSSSKSQHLSFSGSGSSAQDFKNKSLKSLSNEVGSTPSNSSRYPSINELSTVKVKVDVNRPDSALTSLPRLLSRMRGGSIKSKQRSSSTSSDSSVEVKKVKLDPDFTPVKYEALKDDLKIAQSRLKQALMINKRLTDNLKTSEESNSALQAEVGKLKEQLKDLSQGMYVKKANDIKEEKAYREHDEQEKKKNETEKHATKKHYNAQGTANENHLQDSNNSIKVEKENKLSPEKSAANCDFTSLDTEKPDQGSFDASQLCETEMEDKEAVEGYQLLPGITIPADVWKLLQNLPKGEKKDIPFIKDLSKYAHGPETLAASTVCGTKKGGRKLDSKEKADLIKKPGLDKQVLQAVRAELVKRVEKEVGKIEDIDAHPRTNSKRYFEAIRGAQKRLKELGFGQGTKANRDIDIKMLQSVNM